MHGMDDFAGHSPHRFPFGLVAALLLMLLLIGAMAWADSDLATDYEAMRIAREEAQKLGLKPLDETAARPRKRKECFVERPVQVRVSS